MTVEVKIITCALKRLYERRNSKLDPGLSVLFVSIQNKFFNDNFPEERLLNFKTIDVKALLSNCEITPPRIKLLESEGFSARTVKFWS